jgi:hypothetical protein
MKWLLPAVLIAVTSSVYAQTLPSSNDHHNLRIANDFEHRMLLPPWTQSCNTCSGIVNPTGIVSCSDPTYAGSGPCHESSLPTCAKVGAGVRFRNMVNSASQGDVYLGAGNPVGQKQTTAVSWEIGCADFSLKFDTTPEPDQLVFSGFGASVTDPDIAASITTKMAAPSAGWNGLSIYIRNYNSGNPVAVTGTLGLFDVKLKVGNDEINLGNFCNPSTSDQTWYIKNYDCSAGCEISGTLVREGSFVGACTECAKVELFFMNYDVTVR